MSPPEPVLRLRNSTTVVLTPGDVTVARAGTARRIRHAGLVAQAWHRLREPLQTGLDVSRWRLASPDREYAADRLLLACLARAGALVPARWWASLAQCHPGLRDFLEAYCEDPRAALAALQSSGLRITGGYASCAAEVLSGWGLTPWVEAAPNAGWPDIVIDWTDARGGAAAERNWVAATVDDGQVTVVTGRGPVPPTDGPARPGDPGGPATRVAASVVAFDAVRAIVRTAGASPTIAGVSPTTAGPAVVTTVVTPLPAWRSPVAMGPLCPDSDLHTFVHRQADPARVLAAAGGEGNATAPRTPVPIRPAAVDGGPVEPQSRLVRLVDLPYLDGRLTRPATAEEHLARGAELLNAALGWLRYEPGQPFNPHAAYPSPRSAFTVQGWWCDRTGCHAWDPAAGTFGGPSSAVGLERPPGGRDDGAPDADAARVVLRCVPQRLPEHYGALRWALCLLELGHAAETVTRLGSVLGWDTRLEVETGVDNPVVTITLDAPAGPAGAPDTVDGPTSGAATVSWAQVLARRSSGHGWGSLVAAYQRMPRTVVESLLDAAAASWEYRWCAGRHGGVVPDLCLVTERVDDLPDGVHTVQLGRPGRWRLSAVRPGALLAEVQQAFRYAPEVMDLTSMNIALVISWDIDRVARRDGDAGLRLAQLQAGGLAQAIGLAASAAGLFCRPARSFDPESLRTVAARPGHVVPSYLCLIGRDRVHGLAVNLMGEPDDH